MQFPKFIYPLSLKKENQRIFILCLIRKKWIQLTPEEWVRQHVLYALINEQHIGARRIAVERQVKGSKKRFDILIHNQKTGKPEMIIECKAYDVAVGQATFNQVGRYNLTLNVPYLLVTNWHQWICAEIKQDEEMFTFLESFPCLTMD